MSSWQIVIRGDGPFHSSETDPKDDADLLATKFVDQLVVQGHKVVSAELNFDGKTSLISDEAKEAMEKEG